MVMYFEKLESELCKSSLINLGEGDLVKRIHTINSLIIERGKRMIDCLECYMNGNK